MDRRRSVYMAKFELRPIDSVIRSAAHSGGGRETEFRITGNDGLVLVIQKNGRKSWRVDYSVMLEGRRQKRKVGLGAYPATTLAEARQAAAELRLRVERIGDVVAEDRKAAQASRSSNLTFSDLVDEYLRERAGLASIEELAREFSKDVLPSPAFSRA